MNYDLPRPPQLIVTEWKLTKEDELPRPLELIGAQWKLMKVDDL